VKEPEFKRQVRLAAIGLPRADVDFALQHYCQQDKTEPFHVNECVSLAAMAKSHHGNQAKISQPDERSGSVSMPGRVLMSQRIAEEIAPWIRRVRQDLFGSESAPFETYDKAVRWLKKEATLQQQPTGDERQRGMALLQEIQVKAWEAGKLLKKSVTLGQAAKTLPYFEPSEPSLRHLPLTQGSQLWRLSNEAHQIADASGFSPYLIIAHLLADLPLMLPPATFRIFQHSANLAEGTPLVRTSILIEFANPQQVTPAAFRELYRRIRNSLGVTKAKPVKSCHESLYHLVQAAGGPPPRTRRRTGNVISFWTQIRNLYNRRHGKTYDDWRGPYRAYHRLKDRLNDAAVQGRRNLKKRRVNQ